MNDTIDVDEPAARIPGLHGARPPAQAALDFLEAADTLARTWREREPRSLRVPVAVLYKEAITRGLKDAVRLTAECMRAAGNKGAETNPGILEARLASAQHVRALVAMLEHYLARVQLLGSTRISAASLQLLKSLELLDGDLTARFLTVAATDGGRQLAARTLESRADEFEDVTVLLSSAARFINGEIHDALAARLELAVAADGAAATDTTR